MRCYIVGMSGFLGRCLAEYLTVQGHIVSGCGSSEAFFSNSHITYHRINLFSDIIDFPQGTDVVYYLAQSPYYKSFPDGSGRLFEINTASAIKTAESAVSVGVRFFCFVSSGSVYAPSFRSLSENYLVRRDNAYSLSKLMAEEMLALFAREMNVVSVRLFSVFGSGQRAMLPYTLLNAIKNEKKVFLYPRIDDLTDEEGLKVSFAYKKDVAYQLEQLALLSLSGNRLPDVLNIGGPEAISIRRFAETIGNVIGNKPLFENTKSPRKFDLIADISLLNRLLPQQFTSFDKAVEESFGND